MDFYKHPTPKLQKTWDAMRYKNQLEKFLMDGDKYAFHIRADGSVYNWYDLYGSFVLSYQYQHPHSATAFQMQYAKPINPMIWAIETKTTLPCSTRIYFYKAGSRCRPAPESHWWERSPYCMGGMEFMMPKIEHFHHYYDMEMGAVDPTTFRLNFLSSFITIGDFIMFRAFDLSTNQMMGISGLYELTGDDPWYINMMECFPYHG